VFAAASSTILAIVLSVGAAAAPVAGPRPDPAKTPGATTASDRPGCWKAVTSPHVSARLRSRVLARYAIKPRERKAYAIAQVVPTVLGGTATVENLWPARRRERAQKAALDATMLDLVCRGMTELETARNALLADWTTAQGVVDADVEARQQSIVDLVAALERAEAERALAEYIASLPPPTTTTVVPALPSPPARGLPNLPYYPGCVPSHLNCKVVELYSPCTYLGDRAVTADRVPVACVLGEVFTEKHWDYA
jgi:hypothetical protein